MRMKHKNVIYICDICDYQATTKKYLNQHMGIKHEEVVNNCDKCDYQSTAQIHLKEHTVTSHKREIHCSKQCDYQTNQNYILKDHKKEQKQKRFEYVRYFCNHFKYLQGTSTHNFKNLY